ncbi:MAG: OmpA family protein [Bacteroidales bacterium]|jgi:outer membrane protein OmpA-like peptidoglycan-associated protein/Tfp pilus assembly protein PilF|nr:OmpA family protein [Bacteroidales bacterium]
MRKRNKTADGMQQDASGLRRTVARIFAAWICITVVTGSLAAQSPASVSKKALKAYNTALEQYQRKHYREAVEYLNSVIKTEDRFVEAHLLVAECYLEMNDLQGAKEAFLKSIEIHPDFFPPVYYSVADICFEQEEYEQASRYLEKYLTYPRQKPALRAKSERLLRNSVFAAHAVNHPVPFQPENIGLVFDHDQYWPSLSVDEHTLIFTALIPKDANNPEVTGNRQEEFFVSDFRDGKWTQPVNLGSPPNTADNEGAQSISADAAKMFFTACNRSDGKGGCDIYYSEKRNGLWTRPRNLGSPVNTSAKETQPSISADGRTLYFVSTKSGGKGGQDIWKSELNEKGEWEQPVNLAELNTAYDESSPFIHFDDRTLYFASDGLPGMGQFDLFVSRKDSAGKWTAPVNLGYPVNSKYNEEGLIVNARGDRAYYSSDRTENNIRNIFTFALYPEVRPQPVSYMRGKIFDAKYYTPIRARFELTDLSLSRKVIEASSDSLTGEFLVCLPLGGQYALSIERKNYLFFSGHITMENGTYREPYTMDFPLRRIQPGEKIVLENIFFDFNSHQLLDESKTELQKIIQFMNHNPTVKIRITGHTDNVGKAAYNLELSQNRARSVANHLLSEGISMNRVNYKGMGATEPVADNNTDEGRAQNRRTEMEILQ